MNYPSELINEVLNIHLNQDEAGELLKILQESNSISLEKNIIRQLEFQHFFELTETYPMTYSSFKNIKMVEEISAVDSDNQNITPIKTQITGKAWLKDIPGKSPSEWLLDTLKINKQTPLMSEKSRSEGLIRPILLELLKANTDYFTLFSGETFHVDTNFGLTGECDFLLSLSSETDFIQTPVFALVEAKKKSIEEGLGQCAAQMIAAYIFNQKAGQEISIIYGCVSTGEVWKFLKLEESVLTIDKEKYYEKFELEKILGILQYFIDSYNIEV